MLQGWVVFLTTILYIGVLFAVAKYGDSKKHHDGGTNGRPYIYAFSLAIYCTTWTIFGSVGFAASSGINFIAIYLGPIFVITVGYGLMQRVLLLSKSQRITSVADFIGARYGKSAVTGGVAASIAVIGTVPYIALQLKAISDSVTTLISHYVEELQAPIPLLEHLTLIIALILAVFAILFGTRHADATEHQHGMMLAVAMESVVKLLAFLTVGIFITYWVFDGFGDLLAKAEQRGIIDNYVQRGFDSGNFVILLILSALVFMLLPRQFSCGGCRKQVAAGTGKSQMAVSPIFDSHQYFRYPDCPGGHHHVWRYGARRQFRAGRADVTKFGLRFPVCVPGWIVGWHSNGHCGLRCIGNYGFKRYCIAVDIAPKGRSQSDRPAKYGTIDPQYPQDDNIHFAVCRIFLLSGGQQYGWACLNRPDFLCRYRAIGTGIFWRSDLASRKFSWCLNRHVNWFSDLDLYAAVAYLAAR